MKKLLLLFTLILTAFAVNAQDGEMEYGYCSNEVANRKGFNKQCTTNALIEIPAEQAAKFEGAQITKVKMYIGNYGSTKAKAVIYNSLDDVEPAYAEEGTVAANEWCEITLSAPYTIGTEAIYVGYQVECTHEDAPAAFDEGPASSYGDILGYYEGDSYKYTHIGYGNLSIKVYLTGDNLPKYDVTLDEIIADEYVITNEEFTLGGTVTNTASKAITSYDVTYQIGDQTPVTQTINCNFYSGESHTFEINGVKLNENGTYAVNVTVSNLNGNADETPENNTLSQYITSVSEFVPRKVLIEDYSTAYCSNCPRTHDYLESIGKKRKDFTWLVHHSGYYPDIYTLDESLAYEWFYGGSTYAPAMMLDRTNLDHLDTGSGTSPVFSPINKQQIETLLDYCVSQPAIVNVDINRNYNKDTRELAVEISGKFQGVPSRETYLHVFLTESEIIGVQSGIQGDYEHNNALRKVMTTTWGDKLTLSNSDTYLETYTCTLDQEWVPENMNIIAFVSFYSNTDISGCEILNTNWLPLLDDAGVNDIVADNIAVWSAGKTICIDGTYNEAAVYTADGRLVATANNATTINVENNGLYIVVVDGTSHKVVVK